MPDKAPAFQFYPKDFLTDLAVILMPAEARGWYITLLCVDWLEDGIPEDRMLEIAGAYSDDASKGSWDLVRSKFEDHPNKPSHVTNLRLHREREKQAEWAAKCAEGGRRSGEARRNSAASGSKGSSKIVRSKRELNRTLHLQSSSSSSISITRSRVSEITPDEIESLIIQFPTVDVRAEFEAAVDWDSDKGKKHKDPLAFFRNWLRKAAKESGGSRGRGKSRLERDLEILAGGQ